MRKILLLTILLSFAFGQQIPQVTPYEKKPLKNKFITIKEIKATDKKNVFDFIIDIKWRADSRYNDSKVYDEIKQSVKLFQEKNGLEGYGYVVSSTDCMKVKIFSTFYVDGKTCGTMKRRYHFSNDWKELQELREFYKD